MQQIKVCEHLPTSDTFCKSVYYLILAKKHQSQQFFVQGLLDDRRPGKKAV